MTKQYMAKLVVGQKYIFGGKTFENGKAQPCDEAMKKHLQQHAIIREAVGDSGRNITTQQFEFTEMKAAKAAPKEEEQLDAGDLGYTDGDDEDTENGEGDDSAEDEEGSEGEGTDDDDAGEDKPAPTRQRGAKKKK